MMGVFVQVNEDSPRAKSSPLGYVIQENGCWEWVGAHNEDHYGVWSFGRIQKRAHREMYERIKGPIPDGLQLDHLCRNRGCVNPDHLEPVTCRENLLRGDTFQARFSKQTHCKRGHPFVEGSFYFVKGNPLWRNCKECVKRRCAERRERKKAL